LTCLAYGRPLSSSFRRWPTSTIASLTRKGYVEHHQITDNGRVALTGYRFAQAEKDVR
jgi:hypothetical protein